MKGIKKIIKSLHHLLSYLLFISMMFTFINCSLISNLLPQINENSDGTISADEVMELCSTSKPGFTLDKMPEEKIIYADAYQAATVTFCNSHAGFTNEIFLSSPENILIADNRNTSEGTTVELGFFQERMELIFAITVQETGYTYFNGPASRNPDNMVHATVLEIKPNMFFIGFEDTYDGGDLDFDDMNIIVNIDYLED